MKPILNWHCVLCWSKCFSFEWRRTFVHLRLFQSIFLLILLDRKDGQIHKLTVQSNQSKNIFMYISKSLLTSIYLKKGKFLKYNNINIFNVQLLRTNENYHYCNKILPVINLNRRKHFRKWILYLLQLL